jgi:hypothetical protein
MTPRRVTRPASSLPRRVGEAALTAGPPQPSRGIRCAVLSGCASSEAVCPNGGPLVVPRTLVRNGKAAPAGGWVLAHPGVVARSRDCNRVAPQPGCLNWTFVPPWTSPQEGRKLRPNSRYRSQARPRTESQASSGPRGQDVFLDWGASEPGAPVLFFMRDRGASVQGDADRESDGERDGAGDEQLAVPSDRTRKSWEPVAEHRGKGSAPGAHRGE